MINSSLTEGMSSSIIEAMACRVPVLARSNDGNLDLIQDQINGYIFDTLPSFELKLQLILDNPDQVKKTTDAAYACYQKHYCWQSE